MLSQLNLFCRKIHPDAILPILDNDLGYTANFFAYKDITIIKKSYGFLIPIGLDIRCLSGYNFMPKINDTLSNEGIQLVKSIVLRNKEFNLFVVNHYDRDYEIKKGDEICSITLHKIYPINIKEIFEETNKIQLTKEENINTIIDNFCENIPLSNEQKEDTKKMINIFDDLFASFKTDDEVQPKIEQDLSSLNALEEYRKSKKERVKEKAEKLEDSIKKASDDLKEGNIVSGISYIVKEYSKYLKDEDRELIGKEMIKKQHNLIEKPEIENVIEERINMDNPNNIEEI